MLTLWLLTLTTQSTLVTIFSNISSWDSQAVTYGYGHPQAGYWYPDVNFTESQTVK
jgi:hypothetical protein